MYCQVYFAAHHHVYTVIGVYQRINITIKQINEIFWLKCEAHKHQYSNVTVTKEVMLLLLIPSC